MEPTIHTFITWLLPELTQQQRNYGSTLRIKERTIVVFHGDNSNAPSKAKLLNDYFSSVFVKEDLSSVPHIESLSIPVMETININPEGIKI